VREALELVRFLTGERVQLEYVYRMRHLPVRPALLDEPPYATDPLLRAAIAAFKVGRSFPAVPRWRFIEKRFTENLVSLWNSLLADPEQDVDALVASSLDVLAQRLAAVLDLQR
jgi:ABC-type glycerol-3-phosphate transport system substrate-binding protein